jgi:arylformamidase
VNIIDISRTVQEAPIYPGASPVTVERVCDMQKGAAFNASMITAGSHMGTHADASCHFLKDSTVGIDGMELFRYYGPCRVVKVPESALVTKKDLEGKIDNCERLVLHGGGNSHLAKDAAEYIVEKGIITVVTDALSVAPLGNEAEIHEIILTPGTAVVESVVLDHVKDGEYTLCAFPIKIGGCDGAPVRAVLISE